MQFPKAWMRRVVVAVIVVAAPAFVFVTFEGLVRGGSAHDRPNLVQEGELPESPHGVGYSLRTAGARLFGTKQKEVVPEQAPPPAPPEPPKPVDLQVPILVYHNVRDTEAKKAPAVRLYDVTPAEFETQMAYLETNGYSSISFAELQDALDGKTQLPPKPVLITLDDGRESQYENAMPALERHHLKATFFVFTNAMDHPNYYTWDQLKEMLGKGMEIQSHTVYHPYLTKADDETLKHELEYSKKVLEEHLGEKVFVVAYPFGLHDERVDAAVRDAGYTMARTLAHTLDVHADARLDLPGFIVTGDTKRFPNILGAK